MIYTVRGADGTEKKVKAENLSKAEEAGFFPVVSNGTEEKRVRSTNLEKAKASGFNLKGVEAPAVPEADMGDKAIAALSGFSKGATMGLGDELVGTAKGIGDYLLGKAAYAVEGQTYDQGTLSQNINRNVAKERGIQETAQKQAPGYALAGQVAGGVASGAKVPFKLGAGAAYGAATGFGESDSDIGLETLKDTAVGAGLGAGGVAAVKGVQKGIQGAGQAVESVKDYAKALGRGAKAGAKEANQVIPGTIGTVGGGGTGAIKEVIATFNAKQELKPLAEAARKIKRLQDIQVIGNGKQLDNMPKLSDEDAILEALILPGDNPVKTYVSQRASSVLGGNIDGEQLTRLLAKDSAERLAARRADPRELAEELVPEFNKAKELFEGARTSRFNELQGVARQDFKGDTDALVAGLKGLIDETKQYKSVPDGVRNTLEDAAMLAQKGDNAFDALQKARKFLDDRINWQNPSQSPGDNYLRQARGQIDDMLKAAEGKIEADTMFKASKELEGKFFDPAEFKNQATGKYEIDAGKLKKLLGNNDAAARFKDQIDTLEEFASAKGMPEAFKIQAKTLSENLKGKLGQMELKRDLGSLRQSQGPSSPGIARLESLGGGGDRLAQAIKDPQGFMNNVDQFNDIVTSKFGKNISQLEGKERSAAIKMFTWLNKNPNSSEDAAEKMWNTFLK